MILLSLFGDKLCMADVAWIFIVLFYDSVLVLYLMHPLMVPGEVVLVGERLVA